MDLWNLESKINDELFRLKNVDLGTRTDIGISRDFINIIRGSYQRVQEHAVRIYEQRGYELNLQDHERKLIEKGIAEYRANFK